MYWIIEWPLEEYFNPELHGNIHILSNPGCINFYDIMPKISGVGFQIA